MYRGIYAPSAGTINAPMNVPMGAPMGVPSSLNERPVDTVSILGLDAFPDIDQALVMFALKGPNDMLPPAVLDVLRSKYALATTSPDNRVLAFYGDALISAILASKFRSTYRLNLTPSQLAAAQGTLAKMAQTQFGMSASDAICNKLKAASTLIHIAGAYNSHAAGMPGGATPETDYTCDTQLSHLVGALYYQYGIDGTPAISAWFEKVVEIDKLMARFNVLNMPAPAPKTLNVKPIRADNMDEFSKALAQQTNGQYSLAFKPATDQHEAVSVFIKNNATGQFSNPIASVPAPGLTPGSTNINVSAEAVEKALKASGLWVS